eukprot:scaffold2316_cov42-Phaeocystis_antarctica.AAC.1
MRLLVEVHPLRQRHATIAPLALLSLSRRLIAAVQQSLRPVSRTQLLGLGQLVVHERRCGRVVVGKHIPSRRSHPLGAGLLVGDAAERVRELVQLGVDLGQSV